MKLDIQIEAEYDEISAYCDWLVDHHNLDDGALAGLFHILTDAMSVYEDIHYPEIKDVI